MEEQFIEFRDDAGNDVIFENQNTELAIGFIDYMCYLNEEQFKKLKEWISKQELNTYS